MPLLGSVGGASARAYGRYASLGYFLGQSLRFRSASSTYLTRTPASAGNRKTWTWSAWVKRSKQTGIETLFKAYTDSTNSFSIYFGNTSLSFGNDTGTIGTSTTSVFRDPSAWYHIVFALDTTQATASDRCKLWVNGTLQPLNTLNAPSLNQDLEVNNSSAHYLGGYTGYYFDGYMGDVYLVDGQALTPSDFGRTDGATGQWIPKKYAGTYGTNGFKLDFKPTSSASGFNTVLYTGTGTDNLKVEGVGFSPDFVWIKSRDGARSNMLYDTVRGATNRLASESTTSELSVSDGLKSFDTDGFTLGTHSNNNTNGEKNVAWCWDGGSSTVSNTDGTVTSNVRANPTYGFSVVSYTGTGGTGTVGHGLTSAPKMVIFRPRALTTHWRVWHQGLTGANYTLFFTTGAEQIQTAAFNSTVPTSSVVSLGSDLNAASTTYIGYCFAEVSGFSKFGSYSGTGSAGNSITGLGFKPAFLMIKRTDSTGSWRLTDITRNPTSPQINELLADATDAETTGGVSVTYDSDGFTLNDGGLQSNASGGSYIYMAFADTRDYQWNFDRSGNNNNWTGNNINSNASGETTYDLMNDVPTLTSEDKGNFCTMNPNNKDSSVTLIDGNLQYSTSASGYRPVYGTIGAKSGKWYMEMKLLGQPGAPDLGWFEHDAAPSLTGFNQNTRPNLYGVATDGAATSVLSFNNTSTTTISSGVGWATNDIIGCAIDMDNKKIWFHRNGTWYPASSGGTAGNPSAGTNPTITYTYDDYLVPRSACYLNYNALINFGQRPFAYTPPTGFKKLNTYNL